MGFGSQDVVRRRWTLVAVTALALVTLGLASEKASARAPQPSITEFSSGISSNAALRDITTGADGNLWFAESSKHAIGRMTPAGAVAQFSAGISGSAEPQDLILGADGNIWFTENINKVGRITPTGAVTEFPVSAPSGAIAPGPEGDIYFTEGSSPEKIAHVDTSGSILDEFGGIPNGAAISDLVSGRDGDVWFTERNRRRVGRITPDGAVTEYKNQITGGSSPTRLTVGADGEVYFTEADTDIVARIYGDGEVDEFTGLHRNGSPSGIAAGADGNLWATEETGKRIARVTPGGSISEYSANLPSNSTPTDITPGPDGNLWFTDPGANAIGRINTALPAPSYENTAPLAVPGSGDSGAAGTYPSLIHVAVPAQRRIESISLRLIGLTHPSPADLDFLLVAPQGGRTQIFSDIGGTKLPAAGVTLTAQENAGSAPPDNGPLASGAFYTYNYDNSSDVYPSPVDPGPFPVNLNRFVGTNPNGDWKLYVNDDSAGAAGVVYGGWALDISTYAAPVPTVESTNPPSPANENAPLIEGGASSDATVHLYSSANCTGTELDSGTGYQFADTGIPIAVADDSSTTIYASETDQFNNVSDCSSTSVTYVEDSEAPSVQITGGPNGTIHTGAPRFEFASSEPNSTFRCRIDSRPAIDCRSPQTFTDVRRGNHTFTVRAIDKAGNASNKATRQFTVDAAPPQTKLTKRPSHTIRTDRRKVKGTFKFKSSAKRAAFECELDRRRFSKCKSPKSYKLTRKRHIFQVRSIAKGLTDPSPARYIVKVRKR